MQGRGQADLAEKSIGAGGGGDLAAHHFDGGRLASMAPPKTDLIQGTLDLLILKTLSLQPLHGFEIARRIEQVCLPEFASSQRI